MYCDLSLDDDGRLVTQFPDAPEDGMRFLVGAVVAHAADPSGGIEVYIDRLSWKERLDFVSGSLGLDSVVAGVAASKHLYAEAIDLVAFHDFLSGVDGIGRRGGRLSLLLGSSLLVLFVAVVLLTGRRSRRLRLLLGRLRLFLRRGLHGHGVLAVYQFVDALVVSNGNLTLTRIALLQPLCEGRLCIGYGDAADTQCKDDE